MQTHYRAYLCPTGANAKDRRVLRITHVSNEYLLDREALLRQTLLVVLAEHHIDGGLVAGHAIGPPVIPEKLANVALARRTTRRVSVAMVTETAAAFLALVGVSGFRWGGNHRVSRNCRQAV